MAIRHGWTADWKQWQTLSTLIEGFEWNWVELSVAEAHSVPSVPGVYVVCGPPPRQLRNIFEKIALNCPLYIGQAISLRNRFKTHCTQPADDLKAVKVCWLTGLRFWFCRVSEDRLDEVESVLIDCFGPIANRQRGPTMIAVSIRPSVPA